MSPLVHSTHMSSHKLQLVLHLTVLLQLCLLQSCDCQLFPVEDDSDEESILYQYGPDAGDTTLPRNDDESSPEIHISTPFRFFGQEYDSLWVNTNGLLSTHGSVSQYTPNSFPLLNDNRRVIAPFWADVDTRLSASIEESAVYYREATDDTTLSRTTHDIRQEFGSAFSLFTASFVYVATWHRVSFFGNNNQGPTIPLNTFQCVLISDGYHSFVIFNYGNITWTTGTASDGDESGLGGTPAQVGFDAGDGVNYYNVEGSRTPDIINIKGRFYFRVDSNEITSSGCSESGLLELSPRSGPLFGGNPITVTGPCLRQTDDVVMEFYNSNGDVIQSVPCTVHFTTPDGGEEQGEEEGAAECVPDRFPITGLVYVRFIVTDLINGTTSTHRGSYQIVINAADHTLHFDPPSSRWSGNGDVTITWDPLFFWDVEPVVASDEDLARLMFIRIRLDEEGTLLHEEVTIMTDISISEGYINIDASAFYDSNPDIPSDFGFYGLPALIPIAGNSRRKLYGDIGAALWFKTLQIYVWWRRAESGEIVDIDIYQEIVDQLRSEHANALLFDEIELHTWSWVKDMQERLNQLIFVSHCDNWLSVDTDLHGTINPDQLPPVPCFSQQARRDGRFIPDTHCTEHNSEGCSLYYSGAGATAHTCYHRSAPIPRVEGHSTLRNIDQSACYDSSGNLITSLNHGAGRLRTAHPRTHESRVALFYQDHLPYLMCCSFQGHQSDRCQQYITRRPIKNCEGYEPPRPAMGNGDPHITTLDEHHYIFNGHGEFWLLRTEQDGFALQGRTSRAASLQVPGIEQNATIWSAFAIQADSSHSRIQVERDLLDIFLITVDAQPVSFVNLVEPTIEFNGVRITHIHGSHELHVDMDNGVLVEITESAGLLNFLLYLPIHLKGNTEGLLGLWNDNPEDDMTPQGSQAPLSPQATPEEVFQYGWTWTVTTDTSLFYYGDDESHDTYNHPEFIPSFVPEFNDPALEQRADELCGAEGGEQCRFDLAATGNEVIANNTAALVQELEQVVQDIQTVEHCEFVGAPANGIVDSSRYTVGAVITFTCNDNYTLQGEPTATCLQDATWSHPPPICQDVDECLSDTLNGCVGSSVCVNTDGSYRCECPDGQQLNDNRHSCSDCPVGRWGYECLGRCECGDNVASCDPATGCTVCVPGWDPNVYNCTADLDECLDPSTHYCDIDVSDCINHEGGYTCSCHPGYMMDPDEDTCAACLNGTWGHNCAHQCACRDNQECNAAIGCVCVSGEGWTGVDCDEDVDECSSGTHGCGINTECRNTAGSYECPCASGYIMRDEQCVAPDEGPDVSKIYTDESSLVVQVRVDVDYTSSLSDTSSSEYQQIESDIVPQVRNVYAASSITNVALLKVTEGSIVLWLSIQSNTPRDLHHQIDLAQDLQDAINRRGGKIVEGYPVLGGVKIVVRKEDGTGEAVSIDDVCDVFDTVGFCENGGSCRLINNTVTCSCLDGYSGVRCDENDDDDDDSVSLITVVLIVILVVIVLAVVVVCSCFVYKKASSSKNKSKNTPSPGDWWTDDTSGKQQSRQQNHYTNHNHSGTP